MSQFLPALAPAVDENGSALASAVWEFYSKGTTTPAALSGGATSATADASGSFATLLLDSSVNYRATLKSSSGKVLYDISSDDTSFFDAAVRSALDASGNTVGGATWSFFTTGTTTPQAVYSDPDLNVSLGSVVTADAAGRFPEIYLDTTVTYKAVLTINGVASDTIDPVTETNIGLFLDANFQPPIEPSGDWDGTAGSGFSSTPTDPTRTTAKPGVRLIVPPNQHFTDDLTVGVIAYANNNGTLIGGLSKVRFHFEGATQDVINPTFQTFTRYDGTTYNCFGYWVTLSKPLSTAGEAQLYVEAIPTDTNMQSRVIGPYSFFPSDAEFDYSVNVAPSVAESAGVSYQSVKDALTYLKSVSAQHPRITITEAGTYQLGTVIGYYSGASGYCTIDATAPVTFANSSFMGDVANEFRPNYIGLKFVGTNITFDMRYITALRQEDSTLPAVRYWFDRVRFTNSGGRSELWRKGVRPRTHLVRAGGWFTESALDNVAQACFDADLVRGCNFRDGYNDCVTEARCVVHTITDGWDSVASGYLIDEPALDVIYTGSEATATLALEGGNEISTRTLRAVYGSTTETFTVQISEAAFNANTNYTVQNVVDWLNSLPGWNATLLDDTRRATTLSLAGLKGTGFDPTNVKDTTLQLVTCFDLHTDWYAQNNFFSSKRGLVEQGSNVIVANNLITNFRGQAYFIAGNLGATDYYAVNNAWHNVESEEGYATGSLTSSQFEDNHSGVVVAHNSWAVQKFRLRTDLNPAYNGDEYCLFANNITPTIAFNGPIDADLVITDNHTFDTSRPPPSTATGGTFGGSISTLFADAPNGDFTPAGELLSNLKTPIVQRNLDNTVRADPASVGAI